MAEGRQGRVDVLAVYKKAHENFTTRTKKALAQATNETMKDGG